MSHKKISQSIYFVIFIATLLRIILAFGYEGTGDTGAFCNAGNRVLLGKEVYADPNIYFSAPPFGLHITALFHFFANLTNLPCAGFWKMPSVLADMGIIILIYKISREYLNVDSKKALRSAQLYAYNPVVLFITGYHGQQDAFWIFFVLASWYVIWKFRRYAVAAVLFSIAIAYKLPSLLLLPPLLWSMKKIKQRFIFVALVGGLLLASLLPEILTSTQAVIKQTFLYVSTPGVWGFGNIAQKIIQHFGSDPQGLLVVNKILSICMLASLVAYFILAIRQTKRDFFNMCLMIIVIFFVFTPGFGFQYLLWPLPFLILTRRTRTVYLFTGLTTFAFIHTYNLFFTPLNSVINFLQTAFYYKTHMLYPYDLYFPLWVLFLVFYVREVSSFYLAWQRRRTSV